MRVNVREREREKEKGRERERMYTGFKRQGGESERGGRGWSSTEVDGIDETRFSLVAIRTKSTSEN